MSVCLFSGRVLSSSAFMMVGPRIAALDAATMTKSLPVMPKRTSLSSVICQRRVTDLVNTSGNELTCLQKMEMKGNRRR